jgi:two-component system, OmpR family, sensor histidine kinase CiaH
MKQSHSPIDENQGLSGRSSSPDTAPATEHAALSSQARKIVTRSHPFVVTRKRLVFMNMLVVSSILAIMALAVYGWELHASDQQVNEQLIAGVTPELQSDLIAVVGHNSQLEAHDSEDEVAQYEPSSPDIFTIGLDQHGHIVFDPGNVRAQGLPDLAAAWPVLHGQQASTLVTTGDDARAYRLYTVPVKSQGQIIGVLQVGQSLAARERQLQDLRIILAGVGAGVLLLTLLASLYLAGRALRPMQLAYERQRQFAAAASHELRTPLAIVRSQAELVERALHRITTGISSPGQETGQRLQQTQGDVGDILTEVDYMARLVRDLVVLARDEDDHRSIASDLIDLSGLLTDTVGKMTPQAEVQGISLQLEGDSVLAAADGAARVYVRGDGDRLRQLILALLENALRYTPRGGEIRASLNVETGRRFLIGHRQMAELAVADTGRGIALNDLPHIFEPFYRAPDAMKAHSGAGLGLALARWIVNAHSGEIEVTSEVDVGTCFTVSLPLASSVAGPGSATDHSQPTTA